MKEGRKRKRWVKGEKRERRNERGRHVHETEEEVEDRGRKRTIQPRPNFLSITK